MMTGIFQPNTLEEAVKILNEKKHRDFHDWQIKDNGENLFACVRRPADMIQNADYDFLTEFEAVAIARAYFLQDLMKEE